VAQRPLSLVAALLLALAVSSVGDASPDRAALLSDLEVNETVDGDAVVLGADLVLGANARIAGDAIAVGGNVRMAPGAEVGRHAVAVFGVVETAAGAEVGGRTLSLSSLASFATDTTVAAQPRPPGFGLQLLAAGGWMLVATGIAFLFSIRMRFAVWSVPGFGLKVAAAGLMVAVTAFVSLMAALGLGPTLGVPLVVALMALLFILKSLGLTALGGLVGGGMLRRWIHQPLPLTLEVFVGVLILLALRFMPLVGGTLWVLISLLALGTGIVVATVSVQPLRAPVGNQ